jgi:hypothetical protein
MRAFKAMSRPVTVERSLEIAGRWTSAWRRAESEIAPARAGGATFANLQALGRLSKLLIAEYDSATSYAAGAQTSRDERVWNRLAPDREAVRAIADDLTEAALLYPGDADVLHNLAVLFNYVGDTARAQKARMLVETLGR